MALFFIAEAANAGERLDHYLQARMAGYSRARLQAWIKEGLVTVNGARAKASALLRGGEQIAGEAGGTASLEGRTGGCADRNFV